MAGPVAGWAFSIVLVGTASIEVVTITGTVAAGAGGTDGRLSARTIAAAPARPAIAASHPGWVSAQPSRPVGPGGADSGGAARAKPAAAELADDCADAALGAILGGRFAGAAEARVGRTGAGATGRGGATGGSTGGGFGAAML